MAGIYLYVFLSRPKATKIYRAVASGDFSSYGKIYGIQEMSFLLERVVKCHSSIINVWCTKHHLKSYHNYLV